MGPVPVVITPGFKVYLGVDGELEAGVTAGMTMTAPPTIVIAYGSGHWTHHQSCTTSFDAKTPQLFGTVTVRGYAGAGLAFKLYGVAGPDGQARAVPGARGGSHLPGETPWWTLNAGLVPRDHRVRGPGSGRDDHSRRRTPCTCSNSYLDRAGSASSGGGSTHYQAPSVRGMVLNDSDGAPLRGAAVELRSGAAQPGGSLVASTHSAADGTYVFSGISAGSYTVVASAAGCTGAWRTVTVLAGQTATGQDVRLVQWESQGITGDLVTTAGGTTILGQVSLFHQITRDGETYWHYEDTDYAGLRHTVRLLRPGSGDVQALRHRLRPLPRAR